MLAFTIIITDDNGENVCKLIRSEPVHCPGKTTIFGLDVRVSLLRLV